ASTTHAERPHLSSGPRRPTCQDWNTARTQPSRLFLNRSYPRGPSSSGIGWAARWAVLSVPPALRSSSIGPVHVLQLGHEVPVTRRVRAQLRATKRPGTAAKTGREPYSECRP